MGYDVLSFASDAREHYIEVKPTRLGAATPFYLTPNEIRFSAEHPDAYSLYRLYEFPTAPRMFSLEGHIETTCTMTPAQYLAVPLR